MTETILVYGATGTQGTPVEAQLLTQGRTTRVVTRDANRAAHWSARGAEVAVADLGDPDSLAKANADIDRVVLQLPLQYDFELHEAYGRNAVDAARAAGVKLVVFNTSAHVIPGENVHAYEARQEVVDYLHASGIPSVVIRPTFYYEIFLGPWIRPGIVDSGVVAFPLPAQFPMSWIAAAETAAYAVAALDRPDLAGRGFDVGGPEALTGVDIAGRFADITGRPMTYVSIDPDDYELALAPIFGETVAFEVAAQVRCMIRRGSGAIDMTATSADFGVEALPLARWLNGHDWDVA
ncbi:SDR family oxidoreductase [Arthrobacter sp. Sr33]